MIPFREIPSPLFFLCEEMLLSTAHELIRQYPEELIIRDDKERNALEVLLSHSEGPTDVAVADLALEMVGSGADVNARDLNNDTPLTWAVGSGLIVTALRLLHIGADPKIPDTYGRLPLEGLPCHRDVKAIARPFLQRFLDNTDGKPRPRIRDTQIFSYIATRVYVYAALGEMLLKIDIIEDVDPDDLMAEIVVYSAETVVKADQILMANMTTDIGKRILRHAALICEEKLGFTLGESDRKEVFGDDHCPMAEAETSVKTNNAPKMRRSGDPDSSDDLNMVSQVCQVCFKGDCRCCKFIVEYMKHREEILDGFREIREAGDRRPEQGHTEVKGNKRLWLSLLRRKSFFLGAALVCLLAAVLGCFGRLYN